ncbi:MAG: putative quinol monooxygenase [Geobacteraceae bacterium]
MSEITVVAKVVAKKESVESVKNELLKLIAPTRKEDGCIDYCLHQDNDNPAVFIFHENWKSEKCLARHMDSDHFKNYVRAVDGMIEAMAVNKMTRIE